MNPIDETVTVTTDVYMPGLRLNLTAEAPRSSADAEGAVRVAADLATLLAECVEQVLPGEAKR